MPNNGWCLIKVHHKLTAMQTGSGGIRVAVVGAGSLGKEHARIYAGFAAAGHVQFAGVFDVSNTTAQGVAQRCGTAAFGSIEDTAAHSDAVSIVTPTVTHFDLARTFLA